MLRLFLRAGHRRGTTLSTATYMYDSVYLYSQKSTSYRNTEHSTSTVSKILMTPGCLNVLNFRTAFRANGSHVLFFWVSNANMLHSEPSSLNSEAVRSVRTWLISMHAHPFRSVVKGPDRAVIHRHYLTKIIGKRGPF